MLKSLKLAAGVACLVTLLVGVNLWGQGIFGTLTGVVTDPSQSVVPGAKITLTDTASGSTRDTVTNAEGYFSFSSVPVGSYSVSVEAANFESYKAQDVRLGGGERRNLNVTLKVGSTSETVEVNAEMSSIATLDSGEKSFALTTKELENFAQVGSNAAEYIKIVPGFGITNGTRTSPTTTVRPSVSMPMATPAARAR